MYTSGERKDKGHVPRANYDILKKGGRHEKPYKSERKQIKDKMRKEEW